MVMSCVVVSCGDVICDDVVCGDVMQLAVTPMCLPSTWH